MKIIRTLSLVILAAMLVISLSSCTNLDPTEQDLKVVGKVGDYDVTYDSLRYFVLNYMATLGDEYKNADSDASVKAALEEDIKNYVSSTITRNYAIMELCERFQLDYNEEAILEKVDDYVDDTIEECGGKKEYKELLDSQYMTDRFYREYIGLSYALNELIYIFADDLGTIPGTNEEIMDFLMSDEFIHTRHICLYKDGENDNALKAEIELIYDKLENGAVFEDLIGQYSEDYQDTGSGYYFTEGEFDIIYEEAAFALDDEEYSDIVETEYGFYIIKRYAKLDSDEEYFEANIQSFAQQIQYALTYNKVFEIQDEMEFTFNEYGNSLVLSDIE